MFFYPDKICSIFASYYVGLWLFQNIQSKRQNTNSWVIEQKAENWSGGLSETNTWILLANRCGCCLFATTQKTARNPFYAFVLLFPSDVFLGEWKTDFDSQKFAGKSKKKNPKLNKPQPDVNLTTMETEPSSFQLYSSLDVWSPSKKTSGRRRQTEKGETARWQNKLMTAPDITMLSFLLLLLLVNSVTANDFLGTVMTYYPKNTKADGSVAVGGVPYRKALLNLLEMLKITPLRTKTACTSN